MIVKKYIQILIILTAFLQVSILSADWGISITGQGADSTGAYHTITLGTCENCTDGWKYGEDEDDYPNPTALEYTNIHFFHLDWFGQIDTNGNVCYGTAFSTDFRSEHPPSDLLSWGIRGSTGNSLPTDIPIHLSWDTAAVDSLSDDYELYLYVGNIGYNMRQYNNISIDQDAMNLNGVDPNIKVLMGACAETNTTTYYLDNDGDGLGSDSSDGPAEYCSGYEPDGWVSNNDDSDDACFSNEHDCAGICDGSAVVDECGICNGDDSSCADCAGVPNGDSWESDCGCVAADNSGNDCDDCAGEPYGSAVFDECGICGGNGIPDGNCDCEGSVVDCDGVCGGDALIDECGECGGSGGEYDCGFGIYECNEANCPDTFDYCLALHASANLKSFYALPSETSISEIMSELGDNVTGVITEGGACQQISSETWIGSQCSLLFEKGYWVIMQEADELCLQASIPIDPSLVYNLHAGANLISFPSNGSLNTASAIPDDIENFVEGVITEGGACQQISSETWIGQCSFNGGMGYWIIATDDISFSFDFTDLERQKIDSVAGLTYPAEFEINQSTSQAFYFADNIKIDNESINDGWILAYHGNTLVGARQWTGEMIDIPVMGNDGNAYSKGYIKSGEIPRFMHFNEYNGEMTDLYSNNTPEWGNNAIFMMGALEERNVLPEKISLSAYPNPFNPVTTLSFAMPNEGMVQLSIYNVSGQLMAKLAHDYRTAGNVEYIWDAGTHPSGVYVARLNIENTIHTQKLVLMK